MLPKHIIKRHPGNVASTMVAEYIKAFSPITIGEEDRIMFSKDSIAKPILSYLWLYYCPIYVLSLSYTVLSLSYLCPRNGQLCFFFT